MSDTNTITVEAPNGSRLTFHSSAPGSARGFVYGLGHRVYGRIARFEYRSDVGHPVGIFVPRGKWAFILAARATEAAEATL